MSDNSVGNTPVSGVLCQREAELIRCRAVESPLDPKRPSDFEFANGLVLVQL